MMVRTDPFRTHRLGLVRVGATCLLTGALAAGIAGCGSSSSTATAASSTGSSSSRYEARLALAKCLRTHGLNVPDPSPSGGAGGGTGGAGGTGAPGGGGGFRSLRDQPNFRSAIQACAKYRAAASPFGKLTPQQRTAFRQDLVRFAECMRAHNVNIPDPTPSQGGGFGIFGQIPPTERTSPAFRSAVQACATNLPFRRGGARFTGR